MPFVDPMLAKVPGKKFVVEAGQWVAEEKYDGHRIVVDLSRGNQTQLFAEGLAIQAWSRQGRERKLPPHLLRELSQFSTPMTLDGELVSPGNQSTSVTDLEKQDDQVYYVFDILSVHGDERVRDANYNARRSILESVLLDAKLTHVRLARAVPVDSEDHLIQIVEEIWDNGGEGVIVKRRDAPYAPGKRNGDFVKIKALQFAVLEVIGFAPTTGEKVDRGPYARVVLRDSNGNEARVKTLNDIELARLGEAGEGLGPLLHPFIGRKLRIAYQERTPDGGYRHPRWREFAD